METRGNSNRSRCTIVGVACALLMCLGACGAGNGPSGRAFHVIVVNLGQGEISGAQALPNLEEFAKTSTSIALTADPAAPPLQSTSSMLTGLTPEEHGAGLGPEGNSPLAPEQTPMAEYLLDHGYNTSAVLASDCNMPPESGLNQGFGDYQAIPGSATDLAVLAEDWIEHHHRQPFFLFVHMPVSAASSAAEGAIGEDEALGVLLRVLASRGLLDSSLVVVRRPDGPLMLKAPGQRIARTDPRVVHDYHLPQLMLEHMALPVAAVRPNSYFTHPLEPLPTADSE